MVSKSVSLAYHQANDSLQNFRIAGPVDGEIRPLAVLSRWAINDFAKAVIGRLGNRFYIGKFYDHVDNVCIVRGC